MLRIAVGLALVSYGLIAARKVLPTVGMVLGGLTIVFSGVYI
jgi:hypothetical protein